MVRRPSYRALRAFLETVHAGSAAAAGRRLGVSASAVSHLIRELEQVLGGRLFLAGPQSGLTEMGQRLQQSTGSAFVAIDRALIDLRDPRVTVRLSTVSTFATLWLLPRLRAFSDEHPDVRLALSTHRRVVTLGVEPFDCSIRWGRGDWRDAESQLLFRERLVLVASPELAARPVDPLDLPRIAALTRVDDWPTFLAAAGGREALPGLVVEDRAQAVQAAGAGLGAAVIDRTLAAGDIAAGRLVEVADAACVLPDGFHFVSSPTGRAGSAVELLRQWIMRQIDSRPSLSAPA